MVYAEYHPCEHSVWHECISTTSVSVEERLFLQPEIVHILVIERNYDDGHTREESVVESSVPGLVHDLQREAREEADAERGQHECDVLVHGVLDQHRQAVHAVASVHDEESFEDRELRDRVVCCLGGVGAFFATDADAYMRFLEHRDIIGTITDRESDHTTALFH